MKARAAFAERPLPPHEHLAEDRVLLRKYRPGDGPGFFALVKRNDDRLRPYFPGVMQTVRRAPDADRYVKERIDEWEKRLAFFFALCHPGDGSQIGQVRFKTIDWAAGKSEVAYFIDSRFEGQGLMAPALRQLIAIGFEDLGLSKIFARVTPANLRSQRVLEACGFAKEGLLRHDFRAVSGELADVLYYGILKADART